MDFINYLINFKIEIFISDCYNFLNFLKNLDQNLNLEMYYNNLFSYQSDFDNHFIDNTPTLETILEDN